MRRTTLIVLMIIFGFSTVLANSVNSTRATYILQVSSNLGCDSLELVLMSQDKSTQGTLIFKSSAFAAVELQEGIYLFDEVICKVKGKSQSFDILKDKISPFKLNDNQAYFGGKLIFLDSAVKNAHSELEVLSNCPSINSRARGDEHGDSISATECRDGTGVDTSHQVVKQIKVFAPKATDEELSTVITALNITKDQLIYLPLDV
ncbi:MAG: hypothetical protein COA74_11825 [Gammaproteobacteria bacterium]|nr:MAG: hypothetical protein COA74_11825 [Gammaproteobacteria bacterium]